MLGMVKYLYAPFRIIDMVVIVSSGIVVWADMIHRSDTDTIYWLRFLQVFQALRLEKRFQPWRIMASVIWSQKEHILITIYIAFLSFLIISFGVYFAERNHPNTQFTSIASSMWWSIVTMYTIGYGDMVPQTTSGKILSTCLIIVGVSIFALPAGILGTGLALKVCKHNSLYNKGFMFLIPGWPKSPDPTHQQKETACCSTDSMCMEMLRCQREFHFPSHLASMQEIIFFHFVEQTIHQTHGRKFAFK